MKIEYDRAKDAKNIAKHGVSLALAESLEWDLMVCREDDRVEYGELRLNCLAPVGPVIYSITLTEGDETYRIISLRKATPREARYYAHHR